MIKIKKILYPTDFSAYAAHAFPYVIDFAKKFRAHVTIIHVLLPPSYTFSFEFPVDWSKIHKDMNEAAEFQISRVEKKLKKEKIKTGTIIEIGTPFTEIVQTAKELEIDLIIMATHGQGVVRHMLLGSTTEKVVRKAPCPALVIRHPGHKFVHPVTEE